MLRLNLSASNHPPWLYSSFWNLGILIYNLLKLIEINVIHHKKAYRMKKHLVLEWEQTNTKEVQVKNGNLIWKAWKYQKFQKQADTEKSSIWKTMNEMTNSVKHNIKILQSQTNSAPTKRGGRLWKCKYKTGHRTEWNIQSRSSRSRILPANGSPNTISFFLQDISTTVILPHDDSPNGGSYNNGETTATMTTATTTTMTMTLLLT